MHHGYLKRYFWVAALFAVVISFSALRSSKATETPTVHVVCFKFKTTDSRTDVKKVVLTFCDLSRKVKQVAGFEWGTNVSPEEQNKGFTHCFVLTFKSTSDRDAYLLNPYHVAFKKFVAPFIDDALIIDYQRTSCE
jgi:hypothetical protein